MGLWTGTTLDTVTPEVNIDCLKALPTVEFLSESAFAALMSVLCVVFGGTTTSYSTLRRKAESSRLPVDVAMKIDTYSGSRPKAPAMALVRESTVGVPVTSSFTIPTTFVTFSVVKLEPEMQYDASASIPDMHLMVPSTCALPEQFATHVCPSVIDTGQLVETASPLVRKSRTAAESTAQLEDPSEVVVVVVGASVVVIVVDVVTVVIVVVSIVVVVTVVLVG